MLTSRVADLVHRSHAIDRTRTISEGNRCESRPCPVHGQRYRRISVLLHTAAWIPGQAGPNTELRDSFPRRPSARAEHAVWPGRGGEANGQRPKAGAWRLESN